MTSCSVDPSSGAVFSHRSGSAYYPNLDLECCTVPCQILSNAAKTDGGEQEDYNLTRLPLIPHLQPTASFLALFFWCATRLCLTLTLFFLSTSNLKVLVLFILPFIITLLWQVHPLFLHCRFYIFCQTSASPELCHLFNVSKTQIPSAQETPTINLVDVTLLRPVGHSGCLTSKQS